MSTATDPLPWFGSTRRFAWIWLLIGQFVGVGVTAAQGQSVQLQFRSVVNVPNTSSVVSCSAFSVDMSYGVISPTTAAYNANIRLPLRGLTFNSIATNPDVSTAVVRGTSPNDTLLVTMKNPLPAGSAGNLSISLQFPCGTICTGYSTTVLPTFDAANAEEAVRGNAATLT